jgi:pyridoxal phosphate enzyme (YggS family)
MTIAESYHSICGTVRAKALSCGRDPDEIGIIAVSKSFPVSAMREALDAGITVFGENKVQEAKLKVEAFSGYQELHLVGHLQSNKAKEAVRIFDLIHSIDKPDTARKVDLEAAKAGKVQRILVQVNTSGEASKSGIDPAGALDVCRQIMNCGNLSLEGLMTVGPLTDDERIIRESFSKLARLRDTIRGNTGLPLPHLSMGMSDDFTIAIEEGATMLRIGSAIFGNRTYPV